MADPPPCISLYISLVFAWLPVDDLKKELIPETCSLPSESSGDLFNLFPSTYCSPALLLLVPLCPTSSHWLLSAALEAQYAPFTGDSFPQQGFTPAEPPQELGMEPSTSGPPACSQEFQYMEAAIHLTRHSCSIHQSCECIYSMFLLDYGVCSMGLVH